MQIDLKMPDLATTDSEIKVVRWLLDVGATVARGQPVLEVETDKAAMEVEAYAAGTLREILAHPGAAVEVGQTIARLEVAVAADGDRGTPASPAAAVPPPTQVPPAPAGATAVAPRKGGLFARNRQAAGIPAPAPEPTPDSSPVLPPLSLAARTAARRLQESKQTVPHFYLQTSANAEALLARRAGALPTKLAWDAFFVWAASRALTVFPKLACRFENEQLLPQGTDSIGVAVDLDGDLYIVAVAAAAGKTPEQISAAIRTGVESLRRNDSGARRRTRNLMTVSNLGMTGVDAFAAIINPPEAAILAIGKVGPAVVAVDGRPVVQNRVSLTLSVDHRVASGRYAAEFLQRLVAELESV